MCRVNVLCVYKFCTLWTTTCEKKFLLSQVDVVGKCAGKCVGTACMLLVLFFFFLFYKVVAVLYYNSVYFMFVYCTWGHLYWTINFCDSWSVRASKQIIMMKFRDARRKCKHSIKTQKDSYFIIANLIIGTMKVELKILLNLLFRYWKFIALN